MAKRLYQCGDTLWSRSLEDGHTIKLPAGSTFFYDEGQISDDVLITIDNHDYSTERSAFLAAECAPKNQ